MRENPARPLVPLMHSDMHAAPVGNHVKQPYGWGMVKTQMDTDNPQRTTDISGELIDWMVLRAIRPVRYSQALRRRSSMGKDVGHPRHWGLPCMQDRLNNRQAIKQRNDGKSTRKNVLLVGSTRQAKS
jgi:hypothetical protein